MKIKELEWIISNKEKLSDEDTEVLENYNLFDQYKTGELDLPLSQMMELMSLIIYIKSKYEGE